MERNLNSVLVNWWYLANVATLFRWRFKHKQNCHLSIFFCQIQRTLLFHLNPCLLDSCHSQILRGWIDLCSIGNIVEQLVAFQKKSKAKSSDYLHANLVCFTYKEFGWIHHDEERQKYLHKHFICYTRYKHIFCFKVSF